MFGKRHDQQDVNPWQQYWGESYGPELKQRLLNPVFCRLETQENIGNLIIDVGSGASPVTRLVKAKPGRKRICVDIAADNFGSLEELRIRLDAEKVGQFRTLSFQKALLRVCAFLGINPKTEAKTERADTIVFSDTLNYVDFRKVLHGFANISSRVAELSSSICPIGETVRYFPTRVSKIIASFMRF